MTKIMLDNKQKLWAAAGRELGASTARTPLSDTGRASTPSAPRGAWVALGRPSGGLRPLQASHRPTINHERKCQIIERWWV